MPSWWLTRGVLARLLLPLAWLFGAITAARRALYAMGVLRARRVAVPVVVVGNLIAGGAGKTPVVLALVDLLRSRGYTPGIVSRGYGGSVAGEMIVQAATPARTAGDEPKLLQLRSRSPVGVGRDRVAAARALLAAHPEIDVLLSDDGLQHRRLARDVQVLVFDERGAGNGWLLPAGPLRESVPPTLPPNTIAVYNAAAPSTHLRGEVGTRRLQGLVALDEWWRGTRASDAALDALRGRPVLAVAGVARPERFFSMLRERGLTIVPHPLPDHDPYRTLPWSPETSDVIVTEKDAVKLDAAAVGRTRVWVAPLDFDLGSAFAPALLAMLPPPRSN